MKDAKTENCWIFDMDETLIHIDKAENEKHFYKKLVAWEPTLMLKQFNVIKTMFKENTFIITARHPAVIKDIMKTFNMDRQHVYCRDYALDQKSMDQYVRGENLATFFKQINDCKVKYLNYLSVRYKLVFFYDDNWKYYIGRDDLAGNVIVVPIANLSDKLYYVQCDDCDVLSIVVAKNDDKMDCVICKSKTVRLVKENDARVVESV